MKVKSLSRVRLLATPWTAAYQAPPSMGFSRQEYRPLKSIKKKRHHFGNKGPYIQSYGFSNSHVWMLELDHTEGWMPKNWSFWTVTLNRSFSPRLELYLEKAMAPHSSSLAWKIPRTEEPGRLQSMGSLGVGHDWATSLSLFTFMHWRRKWQSTPVFLSAEFQGRGSLVGCSPWGLTESDTTEMT